MEWSLSTMRKTKCEHLKLFGSKNCIHTRNLVHAVFRNSISILLSINFKSGRSFRFTFAATQVFVFNEIFVSWIRILQRNDLYVLCFFTNWKIYPVLPEKRHLVKLTIKTNWTQVKFIISFNRWKVRTTKSQSVKPCNEWLLITTTH